MAKVDVRLERVEEHLGPTTTELIEEPIAFIITSVQDILDFNDRLSDKEYRKKMVGLL